MNLLIEQRRMKQNCLKNKNLESNKCLNTTTVQLAQRVLTQHSLITIATDNLLSLSQIAHVPPQDTMSCLLMD